MIRLVIKPFKLEDVRRVVDTFRIKHMSVYEIRDLKKRPSVEQMMLDGQEARQLVPRLLIELLVHSHNCGEIVNQLIKLVRTGKVDDGVMTIQTVDEVVEIYSGETEGDVIEDA